MITILTQNHNGCSQIDFHEFNSWDIKNENEFVWLDLWQPTDAEAEKILKQVFNFHPLAIEDCIKYINQNEEVHLPKIDNYNDYLFLVFNGLDMGEKMLRYSMFSLSCFIGHNFIITVHNEKDKNVIISNINEQTKETILKKGPDYALHIILDSLVDKYYPLMDYVEDEIDKVEDFIFKMESSNRTLIKILNLKRELLKIKRIASYQKEILFKLYSGVYDLISKDESMFYRNVYDHLLRIVDSAESYRDIVTGLLDSYLSIVNNNMNNIMKRLTLIATIILPLNLITGIYGMNFEFIPFMHSESGFYISLGVMVAIIIMMLIIFKKAGWITLNSFKNIPGKAERNRI
ncbi:MAG: magnesium/cobalt transporter CorA [Ignavibacteria bacterium]|nr:magnesium/cobalt transporter CorA [Ignavibacteria bacterium]